jgi:hypothetical protein
MFFSFYFYLQKKSLQRNTIGSSINSLQGSEGKVIEDLLRQPSNLFRILFVSEGERKVSDDPLSIFLVEVESQDSHDLRKEDHPLQRDPSK